MDESEERRLELRVSQLLRVGVGASALLLSLGWGLDASGHPAGAGVMDAGIRALIATPIVRVVATFVVFLRQRDGLYTLITAIVLGLLATGVFGGIHL